MALTFFLKDTAINGFGSLSVTSPGASTTNTGWVVGKTAATNFSKLLYGTERAASTFGGTSTLATPATPASGDSWRSETTYNGTFANANWVFTFALRAVTTSSSQQGRVRCRFWRSVNADGSSGTQLTSATQVGTTTGTLVTGSNQNSVVTWSPGGTVTLTDEYLFVQCEWEITQAGGSNTADADFRAADSTLVTPNFTISVTVAETGSAADTLTTTATYNTTLAETGSAADTLTPTVVFTTSLNEATSVADTLTVTGTFNNTLAESGTASDTLTTIGAFGVTNSETANGVDTLTTTATFNTTLGEIVNGADTLTAGAVFPVSLSEAGTALDGLLTTGAFNATLAEATSAADSTDATIVPPTPVGTLVHNLPFLATMGKLKSF